MEKGEHAAKLRAAIARAGFSRQVVADAVGVNSRTVTNWTTGAHMPGDRERERLRRVLPGYDDPGDPVENAVHTSQLTEDRRYELIAFYKRLVREQRESGNNPRRRHHM